MAARLSIPRRHRYFFEPPEQHVDHVGEVSAILKSTGVTLQLKKRKCFARTIIFLDHVIRPRRIGIVSHTTDDIRRLRAPTNLTKRRFFVALWNVYWQFVRDIARLASPINKKLCKDPQTTRRSLTGEGTQYMSAPKKALISPLVLTLLDSTGHITRNIDACTV